MIKATEEAIKEAKREYYKNWRANNKDKVKAINQRFWEKKRKELEVKNDRRKI